MSRAMTAKVIFSPTTLFSAGSGDEEPLHLVQVLVRNTVDFGYSPYKGIDLPLWNEGLPDDALLVDQ